MSKLVVDLFSENEGSLGILVCGHGSRSKDALEEFASLVKVLRQKLPLVPIEFGYLEFANPIISEALDRLRARSVKKVLAVPAMLFAAGHAKNDIPSVLNSYSSKTGLEIQYGRELGVDRLMISAAGQRIKEVIDSQSNKVPNSESLLVVVGRGSSDPDANSNVSKITRMLVEAFGFAWGETIYSGVTFPLVEPGLRYCSKLGFKRIIIFPYFLFSGVLIKRIHEHTQRVSLDNSSIEFLVANYFGKHPLVVDTFIERIKEILIGDTSMNCSLCKYRDSLLGFENDVGLIQQSHHHHVEGFSQHDDDLKNIKNDNPIDLGKAQDIHGHGHAHDHGHGHYPNADHPLGPNSL